MSLPTKTYSSFGGTQRNPYVAERGLSHFQHSAQYRQIQSEISGVQFCNRPFLGVSYVGWANEQESKCFDWTAKANGGSGHSSDLDLKSWYGVFMIHRPCEANPNPGDNSILSCFNAIEQLVAGYWGSIKNDVSKLVWHCLHNCFEAGTVLLHVIVHYPQLFKASGKIAITSALDVINQVTNVFCLLSSKWPAAWLCGELFDTIKREALQDFFGATSIATTTPSKLGLLGDMVLHRPGDTQYTKDIYPFHFTEDLLNHCPDSSSLFGNTIDWEMFDFSFSDLDFDSLDWTSSSTPGIPAITYHTGSILTLDPLPPSQRTPPSPRLQVEFELTETYLETALSRLPPCTRCKGRKTRCDRLLPSCRQCVKSSQECKYYDQVLSQETPRPYVFALVQKYNDLVAKRRTPSKDLSQIGSVSAETPKFGLDLDMDVFSIANTVGRGDHLSTSCSRLVFGKSSVFSSLCNAASTIPPIDDSMDIDVSLTQLVHDSTASSKLLDGPAAPLSMPKLPSLQEARQLSRQYYHSFETCYPVLGSDSINIAIDCVYSTQDQTSEFYMHSELILWLVLAIACCLISRKDPKICAKSKDMFNNGMKIYLGLVPKFQHPSHRILQVEALICCYILLDPAVGNVWRILGHTCRKIQNLRRKLNASGGGSLEEWTLFMTIFRIEWWVMEQF